MGSFGQAGIGKSGFGGGTPTRVLFLNIDSVDAINPVFQLAAEYPDPTEHVWFEAWLRREGADLGHWQQQTNFLKFSSTRTDTHEIGGFTGLTPGLSLEPGQFYQLSVRATTDPLGDLAPSKLRWWTDWTVFTFKAGVDVWQGEIPEFFLWENVAKNVTVPYGAKCRSVMPYAEWTPPDRYDYFIWGITTNAADAFMPFKTAATFIDFGVYPLFDGDWIFRIAPVFNGVVGIIRQHKFSVIGTTLNVS